MVAQWLSYIAYNIQGSIPQIFVACHNSLCPCFLSVSIYIYFLSDKTKKKSLLLYSV